MKKLMAIAAMMFMGVAFVPAKATAQVNIQINIGNQPAWGPTGYDYAQFYYFPDYNFYYDIMSGQYIIYRRNAWVYTTAVPASYGFDPYRAYKVVINQNRPFAYNASHIRQYGQYKGQWARQAMIRDSREFRYYASTGHPRHNEWTQRNQSQKKQSSRVKTTGKRSDNKTHAYTSGRQAQNSWVNGSTQNGSPRQSNVNTGGRSGR